jgi:hypothetical protein
MIPKSIDAGLAALIGATIGAAAAILTQLIVQVWSVLRDRNERRRREQRVGAMFDGYLAALEPFIEGVAWDPKLIEDRLQPLREAASEPADLTELCPLFIRAVLRTIATIELALGSTRRQLDVFEKQFQKTPDGQPKGDLMDSVRQNLRSTFEPSRQELKESRSMIHRWG